MKQAALETAPTRGSVVLLILGSVLGVISMVLHPTGGHGGAMDAHAAAVTAWVHGVAIASLWIQFAGLLGARAHLRQAPARRDLGLVAFGVGALFASLAATANGIAVPTLIEARAGMEPAERSQLDSVWYVLHLFGDVGTTVFFVGAAVLSAAWGSALVGAAKLGGIAVAAAAIVALALGALRPEVHPMLVFVAGFEAWVILVALWLKRTGGS